MKWASLLVTDGIYQYVIDYARWWKSVLMIHLTAHHELWRTSKVNINVKDIGKKWKWAHEVKQKTYNTNNDCNIADKNYNMEKININNINDNIYDTDAHLSYSKMQLF